MLSDEFYTQILEPLLDIPGSMVSGFTIHGKPGQLVAVHLNVSPPSVTSDVQRALDIASTSSISMVSVQSERKTSQIDLDLFRRAVAQGSARRKHDLRP